MEIPKKLIDCLNKSEISYEILHHPAAFTAQTIAAVEHIKGHHHAKVVMVKSGDQHLMAVLPADHRIDIPKLEKITGEPASVQNEKEFGSLFPDCAVGTMPPFGNLYDVPTYVDKTLTEDDYIVFEAGTYTDAIKLRYQDYEQIAKPRVEDFSFKVYSEKRPES